MTILAVLGKRFQDAGLRDLCIELGLIVQGSVSSVLDGKMYNGAVRVHKTIYERLLRTAWKGFIPWLEANFANQMIPITALMLQVQVEVLHDDISQETFYLLMDHEDDHFVEPVNLEYLRHSNGDLSAFWMTYLDMAGDILLQMIRASSEGNWELHLVAIRKLIQWCFAYDRTITQGIFQLTLSNEQSPNRASSLL